MTAIGATFARFIPELKARYDYGMMIFILTFCLVTVSSFRDEKIIVMAQERLTTIAIGVAISFFTTTLVFPIWAGEDLHRLQVDNLEKLAKFLQGKYVSNTIIKIHISLYIMLNLNLLECIKFNAYM